MAKVVTGKVRFSYVNVFAPRASNEGQEPKYSTTLLIPKSDKATLAKIDKAITEARLASAALFSGKVPANLKNTLHDGDGEMPNGGEYPPEAKNHYVISASSRSKPGVVDRDLNPILDTTEFYSGCYGRASLNFFAYNVNGNKGVACGLNNVQKLDDGEALGGRARPEDDFEEEGALDL